jgi:hypothetical protein
LWLFLMQTGWNLATVFAVDISEEANWFEAHPQKPNLVVLHSFKNRSDLHQFAITTLQHEWRPYQILRFMIEITEPLRRTLRKRMLQVQTEFRGKVNIAVDAQLSLMESAIKSPWLFHSISEIGRVDCFRPSDSVHLNEVIRAVIKRHDLARAHPRLAGYTTSNMRDAWIGHAYSKSGYDVLVARLASQHSNFRSLRHYLNRRRYREHSEAAIRKVQTAAFSEISERRPLDLTRLRLLVENGAITVEQAKRLADYRQRTRLGMGCLDPHHPPPHIAPGHPPGEICRIQRCLGCEHGVVFQDSLESLGRANAELIWIKREIPYASWVGSSFEKEENALSETLAQFEQSQVQTVINKWLDRFRNGEAVVHDVYPSY